MRLVAFAASNSKRSINKLLVEHAVVRYRAKFNASIHVEFLDLNDYEMEIYSIDRESDRGVPIHAKVFLEEIRAADALFVSFAEHNGTVSAAWKNIFDWVSRIDVRVWQDKPMLILAATPGPRGGAGVLRFVSDTATHFGGNIVAEVGISHWMDAFDPHLKLLTSEHDIAALDAALSAMSDALAAP